MSYSDLFKDAKARDISVLIQNHSPNPSQGSRNIYAEDKAMIHQAAKANSYSLVDLGRKAALFAPDHWPSTKSAAIKTCSMGQGDDSRVL